MKFKGLVAGCALVATLLGVTPAARAQDEAAATTEETPGGKKKPFSLYIEAATGTASADDLNQSLTTLSSHVTVSSLSFDDQPYARAAIGWQLQRGKGDFRLVFNGYKEDGYRIESFGSQTAIDPAVGTTPDILGPLLWWTLAVEDGELTASRTPPQWTLADDANQNGFVDPGEQRYVGSDIDVNRSVTDDLQNRAQHFDLVYGKRFGKRRYTSRWWAGLRHFQYDGNVPTPAWLGISQPGLGYTDGAFLRMINFQQESSGTGPTGSMSVEFNLFDQRLTFYLAGQAAFIILDTETHTGTFFSIVESTGGVPANIPVPASLDESSSKSSWQTHGEVGARYRFRNGLTLHLAWNITGYLDAVLLPTNIRIPANLQEASQGVSAIYTTQDYVLESVRGGISFQF